MPHGHCYLWQTPLVGLHLISDLLIAIAYFSIPAMLLYFVHKRRDVPFLNVFILFGAFIILCGLGHLLEVWTLWYPAYWISGIEQGATAFISCYTAVELSTLLPQFLSLKTPEQLEAVNQQLQQQIIERQHAEQTLKNIVRGTASVTGKAFFPALVQHLASALDVRYAFMAEIADSQHERLKTVAFWMGDKLGDNLEYEIAGTPCEAVVKQGQLQYYPDRVRECFPLASGLKMMQAECYLGVPLLDGQNQVIGVLCVSSDRTLANAENAKATISVFAARAAAELQRQTAESALRRAYDELELRVEQATQGLRQRTAELVRANTSLESEIQERKRAEEAAAAASRAKSEFLANMSHELRTPLNAILGFAQVMHRDSSLSQEHQQNLDIINRAGEHLLGLIDDILEVSKIEAGRTTLNESSFDFYALLDSLEAMFRIKTESQGLELICDRALDVPQYLTTDESKLRQILLNLLGNAIKFTAEGGVTLRVAISQQSSVNSYQVGSRGAGEVGETQGHGDTGTRRWEAGEGRGAMLAPNPEEDRVGAGLANHPPGQIVAHQQNPPSQTDQGQRTNDHGLITLQFEIEDTGPGIAPEEIEQLFQVFGQTEIGKRSRQGTGLGLSISQKFVQMMGGNITVSSTLGQGSIFAFNIQVCLADPEQITVALPKRKVIGLASEGSSFRILVVDDRLESRLLLIKLLTSLGFEVEEAENGLEAMKLWQRWQPHLIWMDMRMPVMDGYEATRKIRVEEQQQREKAVQVSQGAAAGPNPGEDRVGTGLANHPPEQIVGAGLANHYPPGYLVSEEGETFPPPVIIIALTASAFEEQRSAILSVGCDDFMRKPFREEELWIKMSQHLGVQYIYEEEEPTTLSATESPQAIASCLQEMPQAWLEKFYNAAAQGSDSLLWELIEQISPEQSSVKATLENLVDNFEFETLLDLANCCDRQAQPPIKP